MRKATYALLLAGRARWPAGATMLLVVVLVSQGSGGPGAAAQEPAGNPLRNAYFGELHVHTNWSLDAYRNGNFEDPAVAYRFGRGEAVAGPDGGARVRLQVPLDFMAVTDHDVWLGQIQLCNDVDGPAYDTRTCRDLRQI
ncbi:MAG: DUF3604 domain-containing protein, partial [Acidobacteria bacterium]|nr:DUF3604 domain-containing protein [Acidobacteriota bacterium]